MEVIRLKIKSGDVLIAKDPVTQRPLQKFMVEFGTHTKTMLLINVDDPNTVETIELTGKDERIYRGRNSTSARIGNIIFHFKSPFSNCKNPLWVLEKEQN